MKLRSASLLLTARVLCACTTDTTTVFEEGDTLPDGGRVVNVTDGGSCRVLTIEHEPVWDDCSAQQREEAKTYGDWGGADVGFAPQPAPARVPTLAPVGCAGLAELRRGWLKASHREQLEFNRQSVLRDKCLPRTETLFVDADGNRTTRCAFLGGQNGGSADAGTAFPASDESASGTDGASSYSTTNTQVVDVDEADFVKNDAGYVYVLSKTGIHVVDAWPAADTHEVNFLALPEPPTRMFLSGDKLVVYGVTGAAAPGPLCTYGYDCRAQAEQGGTSIRVFDVRDPAAPTELRHYELSGGYVSSRRVGNFVYTVVSDQGTLTAPGADLGLDTGSSAQLEDSFATKLVRSDALVDGLEDAYFLPWAREARANQAARELPCDDGLAARAAQGEAFSSLITIDLAELGAPHRTLVAASPGFVYASATRLYLATDYRASQPDTQEYDYGDPADTELHAFALDGATTGYVGSGLARGTVLNQFSMDERDGYLRVATSVGRVPDPAVTSRVTVFGEGQQGLDVVGTLANLAPQEDIRSVRFDGDRAFLVTFKKTDPLFAIDLSVPSAPAVLGELKIPGFSTYMHPLDHDHLLAIGFDADDQGSFAYFNGIQLQIFDIHDLTKPTLLHKTTVGTRGSASDALTNHLAFNYFAPQRKLALPMTVCEGGGNGTFGDDLTFSGLMLFDVSLDAGIVESGRMPFVEPSSVSPGSCGGWWTSGGSVVKRSIFMDEFVIGLSESTYKVAPTAGADQVLKTLSLVP